MKTAEQKQRRYADLKAEYKPALSMSRNELLERSKSIDPQSSMSRPATSASMRSCKREYYGITKSDVTSYAEDMLKSNKSAF